MFHNNNKAKARSLAIRCLKANKKRNIFIIVAIVLTSFMISSVLSIGVSYYQSIMMREQRMQGSISHLAFGTPTQEQIDVLPNLDYVKHYGIGTTVGFITEPNKLNTLPIGYVDGTQWNEMFVPTFTDIVGTYPTKENEVMLSRYLLDRMDIENPSIGMEVDLSFQDPYTEISTTDTFIVSGIYTEYTHSRPGGFVAVYCSEAFAVKHNAMTLDRLSVNVEFTSDNNIEDMVTQLATDLSFGENQSYLISPATQNNFGDVTTYLTLLGIIVFLMIAGYLFIYNVMYLSVSSDIRFFGMLKTLGTTRKQIKSIVLYQILCLSGISIPIGCLLAASVSLLIIPSVLVNSGIDTGAAISFSPIIYIGTALFSLITVYFGALTPAKTAMKISPIEGVKFVGMSKTIKKTQSKNTTKSKLHRIALRNIFRNRKSTVIVILSLFLGMTTFTTIMTVVNSIDIDEYINAEYYYDFSVSGISASSYFLTDDVVQEIVELEGITLKSVMNIGAVEIFYTDELKSYASFIGKSAEQLSQNGFDNVYTIKGVDAFVIEEYNKTLETPIDIEAFLRGEFALINILQPDDISEALTNVSKIDVMNIEQKKVETLPITAIVQLSNISSNMIFGYSTDFEIIVAKEHLAKYSEILEPYKIDFNVGSEYEEQIYNTLADIADIEVISKYAGRRAMEDSKTIMTVLGGGASLILWLIGIINFVNVMSVSILSRKLELSMLESVGMQKQQTHSMLRFEGMGYSLITILATLTIGNGIVFAFYLLFKTIVPYAQFSYPIIPVLLMVISVLIICFVTPSVVYKKQGKISLVERLREI